MLKLDTNLLLLRGGDFLFTSSPKSDRKYDWLVSMDYPIVLGPFIDGPKWLSPNYYILPLLLLVLREKRENKRPNINLYPKIHKRVAKIVFTPSVCH